MPPGEGREMGGSRPLGQCYLQCVTHPSRGLLQWPPFKQAMLGQLGDKFSCATHAHLNPFPLSSQPPTHAALRRLCSSTAGATAGSGSQIGRRCGRPTWTLAVRALRGSALCRDENRGSRLLLLRLPCASC